MKAILFCSLTGIFVVILMLFCSQPAHAQTGSFSDEEKAIRAVIQSAYVDGLQNWGDIEKIRAGFHPTFELLSKTKENEIQKLPIGKWIEMVEARKAQNPGGPDFLTTADIIEIDITADAAMAKLDLIRNEKRIFTDYLLFYKFDEGWRIVGKIYHRLP